MKGTLRVRSIAEGFNEIYLEQLRITHTRRVRGIVSQTNYYVGRNQWNDIVNNDLIGKEVEFEELKGLDGAGREILFAKITIPAKTYTQAELEEFNKKSWHEGYIKCMNNFQCFPLETKVYLQHEVDVLIHSAYIGGNSSGSLASTEAFNKWYYWFKKLYNEKGYAFFKKILG